MNPLSDNCLGRKKNPVYYWMSSPYIYLLATHFLVFPTCIIVKRVYCEISSDVPTLGLQIIWQQWPIQHCKNCLWCLSFPRAKCPYLSWEWRINTKGTWEQMEGCSFCRKPGDSLFLIAGKCHHSWLALICTVAKGIWKINKKIN